MTTIETFKKMLDWLCANVENVKHQTDVARAAGLNETTVSRIMKGRVKSVSQTTLRAVNAAYGNPFNPEWLRGESDVMLVADLAPAPTVPGGSPAGITTHVPAASPSDLPSPTLPDYSSMVNAIIAAKDDAIASLKRELASKEETIAAKEALIATKDTLIANLQQQLNELRARIAIEKGVISGGYPFAPGVAEQEQHRPAL